MKNTNSETKNANNKIPIDNKKEVPQENKIEENSKDFNKKDDYKIIKKENNTIKNSNNVVSNRNVTGAGGEKNQKKSIEERSKNILKNGGMLDAYKRI